MTMSGTHTEVVLNKLTKPKLVQLILKTEATQGSQITDLFKEIKYTLTHQKKLEADNAIVRTVNDRLVERVAKTESAGKTPSIPDKTLWRLLAFQSLLIIVSLKKRCVVSSKRLVSKLMNRMFKPAIA